MEYYSLLSDKFVNLLTYYEFGSDRPSFKEGLFGDNPTISHIPIDHQSFGAKTLILDKETGAWCFLDAVEMEIYLQSRGQRLSTVCYMFPQYTREVLEGFLVKLYWLGLLRLEGRQFLAQETFSSGPISEAGPLFILLVTNKCNLSCSYCCARSGEEGADDMDLATAKRTIDMILAYPSDYATIEFAGGEPLLRFDLIRETVSYAKAEARKKGKRYKITIQSNGTILSREIAQFIEDNRIQISLSLDGDTVRNNATRQFRGTGKGTYDSIRNGMRLLGKGEQNFGLICVLSKSNFRELGSIIEHFESIGLLQIKLNPVCKIGRASDKWNELLLEAEEFLGVHKEYLLYASKSPSPIVEENTQHMLRNIGQKMHTYRCMRSQCGAGKTFYSIDPSGTIFPCDRFRTDAQTAMGNVHSVDGFELLHKNQCMVSELLTRTTEAIGECADCLYKRFCEAGCTFDSYYATGNAHSPHPWCEYYKGAFASVFKVLASDMHFATKLRIEVDVYSQSISQRGE